MALSRPLMNFNKTFGSLRTFSSSAQRFSGAGAHPTGKDCEIMKFTCYFKFRLLFLSPVKFIIFPPSMWYYLLLERVCSVITLEPFLLSVCYI